MFYFYFQNFLLSQNDDLEKWVNILFVVVLAVVWAIGGILKSKAEQARIQKNKQPLQKPPSVSPNNGRDPAELILEKLLGPYNRSLQAREGSPTRQTAKRPPGTQSSRQRYTDKHPPDKFVSQQKINNMRGQKPFIKEQPVVTDVKLPEVSPDIVQKKESLPLKKSSEKEISLINDMLDFNDTNSLRKAILYYEVLGKPLSLRETSNL